MHLQNDMPKLGDKSRAMCVKEALMIVAVMSKHIKVLPKDEERGEILDNTDDFMTTNKFSNQYMFDTKMAGKTYYGKHGLVDKYSTKIRLESDITIQEMKFKIIPEFLAALKSQHIYLKKTNNSHPEQWMVIWIKPESSYPTFCNIWIGKSTRTSWNHSCC